MTTVHMVVPCYNEEKRLDRRRFLEFAAQHHDVRLTMVDDGSRDQTPAILQELQQQSHQRIQFLQCPENGGKSEAVRRGMRHVLETETGDIAVGFIDADLSAPLESSLRLASVLKNIPEVEIVFGSRFPLAGRNIQRHWARKWLGFVFSSVASSVIGLPLRDTQCGAKLFRVTPALRLALEQPFRSRWIFDVELLGRYLANSYQLDARKAIYEFPLDQWREIEGSKLKSTDFLRAIYELGNIAWDYHRGNYVVDAAVVKFPETANEGHDVAATDARKSA
ncbi:glycosyltransferase [Bremerella sp. JC770]|uniref:glycosyltransferase n=1 Tax=Bremerella sp. JC770 TaxID=3232137 RepID=UPI00345AEDBE